MTQNVAARTPSAAKLGRLHRLTITLDGPTTASPDGRLQPQFTVALGCPGGKHCIGRQECVRCRYADDPDDANPDIPTIRHGQRHWWTPGYGWGVAYPGCVIEGSGAVRDAAGDILNAYGPGTYLIDDDWDDQGGCYLTAVIRADGTPLGYSRQSWLDQLNISC